MVEEEECGGEVGPGRRRWSSHRDGDAGGLELGGGLALEGAGGRRGSGGGASALFPPQTHRELPLWHLEEGDQVVTAAQLLWRTGTKTLDCIL